MSRQRIAYHLDKLIFKHLSGMSVNYTISESKEAAGNRYHQECFYWFFVVSIHAVTCRHYQ